MFVTRKGCELREKDVRHLSRMVCAIRMLLEVPTQIDACIDEHGGWPCAFVLAERDEG